MVHLFARCISFYMSGKFLVDPTFFLFCCVIDWHIRVFYYICAQKIPQNLLCLLCSVGCRTAVRVVVAVLRFRRLNDTLSAAFHLWSTNSISQVVTGICIWWSSLPQNFASCSIEAWFALIVYVSQQLAVDRCKVPSTSWSTLARSVIHSAVLSTRREKGPVLSTKQSIPNIMQADFWHQFFYQLTERE